MAQKSGMVHLISNPVKESRSDFPQHQSDDRGKTTAFFVRECRKRYQIKNKADTYDLLQKLGKGRNGGFFTTDIVAVNASGNCTERKGKRENPQRIGSSFFHKEILGAGSGSEIDESGKCQCDSEGKEHGTSHEAGGQGDIAAAVFFRYQLGYGGLDAGGIEGIADSVNRKDKLIDTQIFRTQRIRETNSIIEPEDTGNQSGNGKEDGSF